jgi:hypothetical protein
MEFIYHKKRVCKKTMLVIKLSTLIFHFFCVYFNFDTIEKDIKFGYYLLTIFSTFLCVCNNIRFEYAYVKIYGQPFLSIIEFKEWKKKQELIYLTYLLNLFEISIHVFFIIVNLSYLNFEKKELLFYTISCLILDIYAVFCILIVVLSCILCFTYNGSIIIWYLLYKSQSSHEPTRYFIDKERECCICLDKNTKIWIETRCKHAFHSECIKQWNTMNNNCPICRNLLQM